MRGLLTKGEHYEENPRQTGRMAQAASSASISNFESSVASACVTLTQSDSSVDQKLEAIETLSKQSEYDADTILALGHALHQIGLSRPIRSVDRAAGIPKGGEVAGAAARALASSNHPEALAVLIETIFDTNASVVVRETAAFGLGGRSGAGVFSVFRRAAALPEPDIRFRTLLSLRESLAALTDSDCDYVRATISFLTKVFLLRVEELQAGEHDLWVSILARYGGAIVDQALPPVLISGTNRVTVMGAFEVLRRRESKPARAALAQALGSHDRPLQLYQALVAELSATRDEASKSVARTAIRRYPVRLHLISLISRGERVRRAIHLTAARAVLAHSR